MKDMITMLYYNELHPSERRYPRGSHAGNLLARFSDGADQLTDSLEGEAKSKLLDLIDCHGELASITAYENFREGFRLGAQMMISIMEEGDNYGTEKNTHER